MKKIIALILATFMIILSLASCNNASKETEGIIQNKTEKQTDSEKGTSDSADFGENNANNAGNGENNNSDNDDADNGGNIADWNKGTYTRNGNKITFGYYPQAEVTDATLIATLSSMAGALPTSKNSQAWTSYGYYVGGKTENFMWYIDVFQGGEKYRGVYFTSYRPYETSDTLTFTASTFQDDNGYLVNTVYWFKYEPISWTILSEDTKNETALILCDLIIDSQAYQDKYDVEGDEYYNTSTGVPSGTSANNYAHSTIRKWLNETFYNTAFTELQKEIIATTTVDNSAASADNISNCYACEDTEDKIFLLSVKEAINSEYGFAKTLTEDSARRKNITDYAKSQGARTCREDPYKGNIFWWLRSPTGYYSHYTYLVDYSGVINSKYYIYSTGGCVLPALQIEL